MQRRLRHAWTGVAGTLTLAGVIVLVTGMGGAVRAADAGDAKAILDKAIQALGGEEKLSRVKAASWKATGTITIMGNESPITTQMVLQGLDRFRLDFDGDFGGTPVKGATVLAGEKGWREFGGQRTELDKVSLADEKRSAYLMMIPITIVPLKGKEFKVEAIGEENAGGKPAVGIRATGADGKEFSLYFDKESGLPVKQVAKVAGFMGDEFTQETTFSDYQEMAGIKKARKIQFKRDGAKFMEQQITEFKVLDTVDPKTFTEPQ